MEPLALNQLNYQGHSFFARLFLLHGDIEPFYDKVLYTEGNIFEECTMS